MGITLSYINKIRPILEAIYFIVNIGLSATVIIGLQQLKLLKQDIQTRNQRAAAEKSVEYLEKFSKEFIPKVNKFKSELDEDLVPEILKIMNVDFILKEYSKEIENHLQIANKNGARDILNELEFISTAALNGVADEQILYPPLSQTYCYIVQLLYPSICDYRKESKLTGYSNIVKLYGIWYQRYRKNLMKLKKETLEKSISEISDINIRPIGLK